jgi:trk system potassium uptake protein TrkH
MIERVKFLFSPSIRVGLIILGILLAAITPLNLLYSVVFIINLIIILGAAGDIYQEYRTTTYSKRFILFKVVVLILAASFLLESFHLFFSGLYYHTDRKLFSAAMRTYLTYFYLLLLFISMTSAAQIIRIFNILRGSPALATLASFSAVIILGAMILTLPVCTVSIEKVSFIDSLFIATSATCVTGLSTVDIGSYYTRFGQLIVLLLIQTGGIGIITLAISLPIIMGSQTTFTSVMTIKDIIGVRTLREVLSVVRAVVFSTLLIEFIGAIFLFIADTSIESIPLRIFYSIFHSISAFCNAGFSLFPDNLMSYSQNYLYISTIMTLVVLGGIGYPVISSLFYWLRDRILYRRHRSFSFHSKIVLSTTSILIISGMIFYLLLEWDNTLGSFSLGGKFMNSLFLSVTPRTAGFNTTDISRLTKPAIIITIILMFIGASPSSTGGGIKTTTFATMFLSLRSLIKNREEVEAFRRTIPISSIYKALNVAFISIIIISLSIFSLSIIEKDKELINIIFEVFSAFGTVGLSLGITPSLSAAGKVIIVLTMLIGRVGPLTIAIIFARKRISGAYKYPEDHIIIG